MADDLRTRIAAVADAHTAMGYDSDYGPNDSWVCNCGWTWTTGGTHGEHVADAVIREMGLDQAWRDCRCHFRYLWETVND